MGFYSFFGAVAVGAFFTGFARKAGFSEVEIGIMNGLIGSCALFSIFGSWLYESIKKVKLLYIFISITSILFFYLSVIFGYFAYSLQSNLKIALIIFVFLFFLFFILSIAILLPWLNSIVSRESWHSFFPNRQIIGGITAFSANLLAGKYLGDNPAIGNFIIVFSIATLFGLLSALSVIKLPSPLESGEKKFDIKNYLKNVKKCVFNEKFYFFLTSQFIKTFGGAMIGPFIILFLLEETKIGFFQISKLLNVSLVTGIIGYKITGYLTKKFGNYAVYKYSLLLGFFIPILFAVSKRDYYFIYYFIYFLSGFCESSLLVSGYGVIFDYAGAKDRSIYNSLYLFAMGVGAIGAPIAGGFLVRFFNSLQINVNIFGISLSSYRILFLTSVMFAGISVIILFLNKKPKWKHRY